MSQRTRTPHDRGCKCKVCNFARSRRAARRSKLYRLAKERNDPSVGYVDIEVARVAVKILIEDKNWTLRDVSKATGINVQTLCVIHGATKRTQEARSRVHAATFQAIEAIVESAEVKRPTQTGRVPIANFHLALRCAQAEGYSLLDVFEYVEARGVKCTHGGLRRMSSEKCKWVHPDLERAVIDFVRSRSGLGGGNQQLKTRAKNLGYKPAIYYDLFL